MKSYAKACPELPVPLLPDPQCLLAGPASGPSVENMLINDENPSALWAYSAFPGALCRNKSCLLLSTVPVTPAVTRFLVLGRFPHLWGVPAPASLRTSHHCGLVFQRVIHPALEPVRDTGNCMCQAERDRAQRARAPYM